MTEFEKILQENRKKDTKFKLVTFEKPKKPKATAIEKKIPHINMEVDIMKRLLKLNAAGRDVKLEDTIGSYECSNVPPSLFDDKHQLRHGTKSSWVTGILAETKLKAEERLLQSEKKTAMLVDAMSFIQQTRFHESETFDGYQQRCLNRLKQEMPSGCSVLHFPGDRYDNQSRKEGERQRRTIGSSKKEFEVNGGFKTPRFTEFVSSKNNKANLQHFLCSSWSKPESQSKLGSINLYLSGGFSDKRKSIMVSSDSVINVPQLASSQEECDTRIILHAFYCIREIDVKRLVIRANDTDILVMLVYYMSQFNDIEVWMWQEYDKFLPVHEISKSLGPSDCKLQPFLHSFSGKDNTSFIYGVGEIKFLKSRKSVDCECLAQYGEDMDTEINNDIIFAATNLLKEVYGGKGFASLPDLRAHMFLTSGRTKDLRCLPPTEDCIIQHLKRSLLATLKQKRAHIADPQLPAASAFGWFEEDSVLKPVMMTRPPFPDITQNLTNCKCLASKCSKNCSCRKAGVLCCIACKCEGKTDKCARALILTSDEESTTDTDNEF